MNVGHVGRPREVSDRLDFVTELRVALEGAAVAALDEKGGDTGLDIAGGWVLCLVCHAAALPNLLAAGLLANKAERLNNSRSTC